VRPAVIIRSRCSSACGQGEEGGRGLELHELQRSQDLELLHIFREVAAREPEVDELALRELRELLDPRLDVVERHALALGDRSEVDLRPSPARSP
jgi:hypothetical protein